mmetsp:Transcript_34252/g.80011  ORF Transcript_34252/g.80011 Transcript_34252/m.80011 type:complete len:215 (-) Transcript_34252:219-863(-)
MLVEVLGITMNSGACAKARAKGDLSKGTFNKSCTLRHWGFAKKQHHKCFAFQGHERARCLLNSKRPSLHACETKRSHGKPSRRHIRAHDMPPASRVTGFMKCSVTWYMDGPIRSFLCPGLGCASLSGISPISHLALARRTKAKKSPLVTAHFSGGTTSCKRRPGNSRKRRPSTSAPPSSLEPEPSTGEESPPMASASQVFVVVELRFKGPSALT